MEESRQDWPSTAEKYTAGGGTKRTKNNRTNEPVEFSKKYSKMRSICGEKLWLEWDSTTTQHCNEANEE
jgi:hypothetical protein